MKAFLLVLAAVVAAQAEVTVLDDFSSQRPAGWQLRGVGAKGLNVISNAADGASALCGDTSCRGTAKQFSKLHTCTSPTPDKRGQVKVHTDCPFVAALQRDERAGIITNDLSASRATGRSRYRATRCWRSDFSSCWNRLNTSSARLRSAVHFAPSPMK